MIRKTSVLHILWSGGIGGAEEYVSSLAKYFDSAQYDTAISVLSEKGELFEEIAKNEKVDLFFIGIKSGIDIVGAVKFIRFLRGKKYDIIHLHTRNFLSILLVSLFARKTAIIISHHTGVQNTNASDIKMQRKTKVFYTLFSGWFKKILAISNTVRDSLINDIGVDPDKVEVVYNGIDLNKFNNSCRIPSDLHHLQRSDKNIIGFVGRMVPFKRPELFIKIASAMVAKNDKYFFIMVGDGPELESCKELITEYSLDEYFELLGFRRDIPDILQLFDALLFTSEGEGFGIVIIEAMAAGIPVFSINDGAVTEIIRHEENGILLDMLDPENLARQIIDVYGNNKLIEKIKKHSVKDVRERFSIEKSVNKMESVYERVLRDI